MHELIRRSASSSLGAAARAGRLLLVAVILVLVTVGAQAQAPTPSFDQINTVARELYCPLCNGVRLDTCELQACIQMREVIAQRLMEGVGKEEIKQEFVSQYGPVVLGEPPRQGLMNQLIWIGPAALLILGAGWLLLMARNWTRQATPKPIMPAGNEQLATANPGPDSYLARVESELADYE